MDPYSAPIAFQSSLLAIPSRSLGQQSTSSTSTRCLKVTLFPGRRALKGAPVNSPFRRREATNVRLVCCAISTGHVKSAEEFDARIAGSSLALCFVGMSNCGKSHWSLQLGRNRDFHIVSVDEEIERAIKPELAALGHSGIEGLAEWMGFPSDNRFEANQARYLGYEESITSAASPVTGRNTVLDTTGSVIYLSEATLDRIRDDYLVVHLEASDDMLEVMTNSYFETPKPVVWGDAYRPVGGETSNESLRRCYPNLLRERRKKYAAISDVTIPASVSLSRDLGLDKFLELVKSKIA